MPRGDRTGPLGAGPMTGRGAGYCAGYSVPGFMNPVGGRGFYGRGGGRGRRGGFYGAYPEYPPVYPMYGTVPQPYPYPPVPGAPMAPETTSEIELAALRNQAEYLSNSLDEIRKRIESLESTQDSKKE